MDDTESTATDGAPHVVMLVGNEVTPDTRVKKMAASLSHTGLRVTVVGITHGQAPSETRIGEARVLRVPLKLAVSDHRKSAGAAGRGRRRGQHLEASLNFAMMKHETTANIGRTKARLQQGKQRYVQRRSRLGRLPRPIRPAVGRLLQLLWFIEKLAGRVRVALARRRLARTRARRDRIAARSRSTSTPAAATAPQRRVRWRDALPVLHDFELAMAPVIDALDPDVIHAHDMHMIGIGERAAARGRGRGRNVLFVYDAHEYVRGVDRHMPAERHAAYMDLENEFIRSADCVITVSEPLAERLMADHDLPRRPAVVMNVPIFSDTGHRAPPSVRIAAGVSTDERLVVYSGRVHESRDVHTLVAALEHLPEDVHLALVSDASGAYVERLRSIAQAAGAATRLHILPYVAPDEVVDYLSSADVGVNLLTHCANHEVALPNKFFEYLYAGLPLLNSDVGATAQLVKEHGLGETFPPEDPASCARALELVLERHEQLRRHLREDERDFLSEFTWQAQESRLVDIYRELLGHDAVAMPAEPVTDLTERSALDTSSRHTDVRLLVGPMNINAWEMAESLRRTWPQLHVEVLSRARGRTRLEFPANRRVEKASWRSLDWALGQTRHVLDEVTHVLSEGGMSVLGELTGGSFAGDLPLFDAHDIRLALWFHGSDIRDPSVHRELEQHSPFHASGGGLTEKLQEQVDATRLHLARHPELPVFATTMDLLDYLPPTTIWTPVVVDTARWVPGEPVLTRRVPVVGHVSTNGFMKGGSHVLEACTALAERGLIDFRSPGRVDPSEMPAWLSDLDIFIDGLLLGDYGAAAAQAMSASRIVVGHVADRVRKRLPGDVPIVSATPDSLTDVLMEIATHPQVFRDRGPQGRDYAIRYHSGEYTAAQFAPFLGLG